VVYISVAVRAQGMSFPFGQGQGGGQYQYGSGSGFVYDRQGHIVTNNHVVEGAERIEVVFSDDTTVPATVVGTDPDSDLAVIKVDPEGLDLVAVELGDSDALKVGQKVAAIGNPFGYQGTLTTGVVSALSRSLPASETEDGGSYSIPDVIQTDAAINPGNSGGPLLDYAGRVVGVNAAIESAVASSSGVGFAIPVSLVKLVVPVLIESGQYEYSYLGISGGTIAPQVAEAMGLPRNQRGALVATVTPGGPADEAGLRASNETTIIDGIQAPMGGDVIVAIDGQAIAGMDDLILYLVRETVPGDKATLTVLRDGKSVELSVTLAARPKS
ncbi:MAG: PDZ domain-containing protein, partial [Chloroflexi bacterium]|nr:PDZ domain-containing protein [Chloroflexota bacterium]